MAVIKTLDDIVNLDDRYDINRVSFYQFTVDGSRVIQNGSLYDIYYKFILPMVEEYTVSSAQRRYYRGKPQLLSSDIYGTPNLAWLILRLNDRDCPSKFYLRQTVKLIPKNLISEVFTVLMSKGGNQVTSNHNQYLKKLGKDVEVSY